MLVSKRRGENDSSVVCYKIADLDPLEGIEDSLVTTNWYLTPLEDPENTFTGSSWRNGGFVNFLDVLPNEQGYGDYGVFNSHHWIYSGTDLMDGDEFGFKNTIVGYETDGALFDWADGIPEVTSDDGTPANTQILGISPGANFDGSSRGHSTISFFTNSEGGAVFNCGSMDWNHGLLHDSIVSKITWNVFSAFAADSVAPDIVEWYPFELTQLSLNNEDVEINNREFIMKIGETERFSIEAESPFSPLEGYEWYLSDLLVGQGSSFDLSLANIPDQGYFELKGSVSNAQATASIKWKIIPYWDNTGFALKQNRPNPVRRTTTIDYEIPEGGEAVFAFYSIDSKLIHSQTLQHESNGKYRIDLDMTGYTPGFYLYNLTTTSNVSSFRKMVVLD